MLSETKSCHAGKNLIFIFFLIFVIGFIQTSQAQLFDKLKKKAEDKIGKEVEKTLEGKDDKKKETEEKSKKDEQKSVDVNSQQNKETENTQPLEINSKYDFIPGEKVIFFDDFSQDAVGDFPFLWNTNGSAEVVTTNLHPGQWMKFNGRESIWTDALLTLPDNYTIEFDVIPIQGKEKGMAGWDMRLMQAKNVRAFDPGSAPGNGGFHFTVNYTGKPYYHTWFLKEDCQPTNLSGSVDDQAFYEKENQKYHIAIWVQKSRIRLYQDQNKLVDLPKAFQTDCIKIDRLRFEDGAAMISNIRIAAGAPDMRNKLMTEGKLVTYGIYFDVNQDVVKPESYGTLKEIAAILKDMPGVKVKIVGHTDSDGDDKSNMDLSKRRAASVKNVLVKDFSIDASLIETDGKGESETVAPNDNITNKALNRRVEFIKL